MAIAKYASATTLNILLIYVAPDKIEIQTIPEVFDPSWVTY